MGYCEQSPRWRRKTRRWWIWKTRESRADAQRRPELTQEVELNQPSKTKRASGGCPFFIPCEISAARRREPGRDYHHAVGGIRPVCAQRPAPLEHYDAGDLILRNCRHIIRCLPNAIYDVQEWQLRRGNRCGRDRRRRVSRCQCSLRSAGGHEYNGEYGDTDLTNHFVGQVSPETVHSSSVSIGRAIPRGCLKMGPNSSVRQLPGNICDVQRRGFARFSPQDSTRIRRLLA